MKTLASEDNILLVNKPLQWSSFDVVKKIRHSLHIRKVGHAGTLDPLATGLMIVCTGKMTKRIEIYQAWEKEYVGSMIIGQISPSYDRETPSQIYTTDFSHITHEHMKKISLQFIGEISQIPPLYSAIKVKGVRAYTLARKNKKLVLTARQINISLFEFTDIDLPKIQFRVVCSKGTYIRSLVHDFGQALGVGALLSSLCRTKIGTYTVEYANPMESF